MADTKVDTIVRGGQVVSSSEVYSAAIRNLRRENRGPRARRAAASSRELHRC